VKINVFIPTGKGGKFTDYGLTHSSISGQRANGPQSPEDEVITAIDESRMLPQKVIARRFLDFLGNHRLTIETLKQLSVIEQQRLRQEFIDG
jgi:hypothetical protein